MIALFSGVPDGLVAGFVLTTAMAFALPAYLVFDDARKSGFESASAWGLGVWFLLIAGFIPGVIAIAYYYWGYRAKAEPSWSR